MGWLALAGDGRRGHAEGVPPPRPQPGGFEMRCSASHRCHAEGREALLNLTLSSPIRPASVPPPTTTYLLLSTGPGVSPASLGPARVEASGRRRDVGCRAMSEQKDADVGPTRSRVLLGEQSGRKPAAWTTRTTKAKIVSIEERACHVPSIQREVQPIHGSERRVGTSWVSGVPGTWGSPSQERWRARDGPVSCHGRLRRTAW